MNYARPLSPAGSGLLSEDDALGVFCLWRLQGQRAVLVTLAGIDGGSPRPLGAQMAVNADGRYAGYLSGGCLEQAIVLEALDALEKGECRLVRYGKGSPFFDVKLPCGSGLDIFFDCAIPVPLVQEMHELRRRRQPFGLVADLAGPERSITEAAADVAAGSHRSGERIHARASAGAQARAVRWRAGGERAVQNSARRRSRHGRVGGGRRDAGRAG